MTESPHRMMLGRMEDLDDLVYQQDNSIESSESDQHCAALCRHCGKKFGSEVVRFHERLCENIPQPRLAQPSTVTTSQSPEGTTEGVEVNRGDLDENKNQCNDKKLKSYETFEATSRGGSPRPLSPTLSPPPPPPLPPVQFEGWSNKSHRSPDRRSLSTPDVHGKYTLKNTHGGNTVREHTAIPIKQRYSQRSKSYLGNTVKSQVYQQCFTNDVQKELSKRLSSVSQLDERDLDEIRLDNSDCNTSNQNHQVRNRMSHWQHGRASPQKILQQYPGSSATAYPHDRPQSMFDYGNRSPTFSEQSYRSQPMYLEATPAQSQSILMMEPNPANSWQTLPQASQLISSWRQFEQQSMNRPGMRPARRWHNYANQGEFPRYSPTDRVSSPRQSFPNVRSPRREVVPQPDRATSEVHFCQNDVSPREHSPANPPQSLAEPEADVSIPPSQLRQAMEVIKRRESLMNVGLMQKCKQQVELRQNEYQMRRRQQILTRQNWTLRRLQQNDQQQQQRFQQQQQQNMQPEQPIRPQQQPPRLLQGQQPKVTQAQRPIHLIQNRKWVKDGESGKWILCSDEIEITPPPSISHQTTPRQNHSPQPIHVIKQRERHSTPVVHTSNHSEGHSPQAVRSHRHGKVPSRRESHSSRHKEGHGDTHRSGHTSPTEKKNKNIAVKLAKEALMWMKG